MLMTQSISRNFFMTPAETLSLVDGIVQELNAHLFIQLHQPGLILQPLGHAAELETVTDRPLRLFLVHGDHRGVDERGTFDARDTTDMVLVSIPYFDDAYFYSGTVGAKITNSRSAGAVLARSVVQEIK